MSSTQLIPIFAVCPRALSTMRLTHYFGLKHGRFLDPLPYAKLKFKNSWSGLPISQDEKQKLLLIRERLVNSGAVKVVNAPENRSVENKLSIILAELEKDDSKIKYGIVADGDPFSDSHEKITNVSQFEDENLFNYDPIELSQEPASFFNHIPNFIIDDANSFKLVDPWFYEINSTSNTTASRTDFLKVLVETYFKNEENFVSPAEIQVYGKVPFDCDIDVLKRNLSPEIRKISKNYPIKIDFFMLNSKSKEPDQIPSEYLDFFGKKVHERFFCADAIYFSFEDSSQNRDSLSVKQKWRLETTKGARQFIDCINENGSVFEIIHHFNSTQLINLGH